MRILVLEPYHGASHKRFLDDLDELLPYEFVRLIQPARAWKWRMRFSAPYFAAQLKAMEGQDFDLILASTFLSLSDFRALAPSEFARLPTAVYWHENQWAYPVRQKDERDRHFVITNYTTALAADVNLFNSEWNRTSLIDGLSQILRQVPDTNLATTLGEIEAKSRVLWPPMKKAITARKSTKTATNKPPLILWNHRWEHDKNPEEFFLALYKLDDANVPFEVAVAGQSFADHPAIFGEARERLKSRIVHWGYVEDAKDYAQLLADADFVVSTARHEFFGLSVMEAALAGAQPVVPNHLSYPEIYPESCLYPPGQVELALDRLLHQRDSTANSIAEDLSHHLWVEQKPKWERMFQQLAKLS